MILTRQKRVPWSWVILLTGTGGVAALVEAVSSNALTFSMRKFTADPALIAFLGSINLLFNFLVAPYVSWKSDRIWTRWGRRKPFMLAGFSVLLLALLAAPMAPSLWLLTAVIVLYQFGLDFGYTGPWSPLLYEIVPMKQRGRMVVIKRVMSISARLLFNWVLIGQFDHIYHLRIGGGALTITGEHVIYFTTAGLVLAAMLHLTLNVRELRPDHPPIGGRFRPREFLGDIFSSRQFLLIYLLLFCNVALMAGLGQLTPLLITEQFGYSKSTMGSLQAATILVDLCVVIPVAALLADRFDRFRTFQVGLVLSTLHPIAYWLFVKYVAVNHVPTPAQIVGFNLYHTMVDAVAALALEPYFFDLAPRAKMGAMNSGFLFMKGTLTVIVANAVGLWVKYFTRYVSKTDHPDYMSGYLCIFVVGILGCLATLYFAHQRQTGKVIEYGKIDEQTVADAAMSDSLEEPGVIPTPVG